MPCPLRAFRITLTAAGLAALAWWPAGAAAEPDTVRLNTFPNAKALALQVGIAQGLVERRGIRLELTFTEASKAQRDGLASGKFDIAQGAVDNAVAMIEGARQDVVIVSGGDSGMNEFYVQPGINGFAELRGRTILVDAPDTAYALQVKKLMAQHGVAAGDYAIKPAGAGTFRFQALVADRANAAAILNPPFTAQAAQLGMKSLGNMVALLGPYQAVGVFAMRQYAERNRATLERHLAAYVESVRHVRDPANRADSLAVLMREHKLERAIAERVFDELVDPAYGFTPDARFDPAGFRNLLALRAEVERQAGPPTPPERYVDLGYYDHAMALVGR
jgi:ABC-type nitrate/sulfonate/bicarbonate transport system substrate-binding protein